MKSLKKISLAIALLAVGSQLGAAVGVDASEKKAKPAEKKSLRQYAEESGRKALTFVGKNPRKTFIVVVLGLCLYKAFREGGDFVGEADSVEKEVCDSYMKNLKKEMSNRS